ncbi:uncharacterized protein N7477_005040 [Penicillium maclennaniae]|uniref:uncharacterized protein n=1 Tax=Penicillium maclennaniae TaxID=1343394 RepID=UPI00253F777F|nr:uncharacterized protein N7477_005040 [Penicillium maclennaniae]KAJ5675106.1 hypothetical protein N7477_005040 [Penicillium maclennaniae]
MTWLPLVVDMFPGCLRTAINAACIDPAILASMNVCCKGELRKRTGVLALTPVNEDRNGPFLLSVVRSWLARYNGAVWSRREKKNTKYYISLRADRYNQIEAWPTQFRYQPHTPGMTSLIGQVSKNYSNDWLSGTRTGPEISTGLEFSIDLEFGLDDLRSARVSVPNLIFISIGRVITVASSVFNGQLDFPALASFVVGIVQQGNTKDEFYCGIGLRDSGDISFNNPTVALGTGSRLYQLH